MAVVLDAGGTTVAGDDHTDLLLSAVAQAGVGGTVVLPPTSLDITPGQVTLLDGQTLAGRGRSSTLNRLAGSGPVVAASSRSHVTARDFRITGSASEQGGTSDYGIRFTGCNDFAIERLWVDGQPRDGIGCDTSPSTRGRIVGNRVTGCYGHGIQHTGDCEDMDVLDNAVWDNFGGYGFVLGYQFVGGGVAKFSRGSRIMRNRARNAGTSGAFQMSYLAAAQMVDNVAHASVHALVGIALQGCTLRGFEVHDSTPTSTFGAAVYVGGQTPSGGSLVKATGNRLDGFVVDGTTQDGGSAIGIRCGANAESNTVTRHTVVNAASAATYDDTGLNTWTA